MKLTIDTGQIEVYMIIPTLTFLYDPEDRRLELGLYFLNYFFTINIKR